MWRDCVARLANFHKLKSAHYLQSHLEPLHAVLAQRGTGDTMDHNAVMSEKSQFKARLKANHNANTCLQFYMH